MTFQGGNAHPLLTGWASFMQDQRWIVPAEADTLAQRATWLGCNDPFVAALYAAHLQGMMGPLGPRLASLYDPEPGAAGTSTGARAMRRRLTAISAATWAGKDLDAEGARSRYELESAIDHGAFFTGDGFAVRVGGSRSRWRLLHRDRVRNPASSAQNTEEWRDGFKLAGGRVVGINVAPPRYLVTKEDAAIKDTYVKWTADDGTPNVIHKPGLRLPGMLRGVSRIAPLIVMQRQVGGVLESHVAAKRLQAIYAMFVEAEDADAYAKAVVDGTAFDPANLLIKGPLNAWIIPPDSKVSFTDTKFNGADLDAYLRVCYKVQCATLQIPVDVVLCQMGEASLSASRAGLDQYDRTSQTEHEQHVTSVSGIIDRVAVGDAAALGEIDLGTDDWPLVMAGKYSRPPKYSTDRLKDANTISALQSAGVSKTTSLEMFGLSYEDEVELKRAEAEFEMAQAKASDPNSASGAGDQPTPTRTSGEEKTPTPEDQTNDQEKPADQPDGAAP